MHVWIFSYEYENIYQFNLVGFVGQNEQIYLEKTAHL